VSALPIDVAARVANLKLDLDQPRGGACVVFLGVPDDEVSGQDFTHHQISCGEHAAFISISASGDLKSAPEGHRAVMISTHCDLGSPDLREPLLEAARRVYPRLGANPVVFDSGTPATYEKYTGRPGGAVGGFKQSLANANRN